jgi:hypothetical protein
MCTNYVPTRADRLQAIWGTTPVRHDWVTEAFPGHVAPFLRTDPSQLPATPKAELGVFGLIPPWSGDGKNFRHCYNARSETVAEKPSFRNAWRKRQWCVIAADAFFEPCYETGKAVRWRIERADTAPMALAGIWEAWRAPSGKSVLSFSMLTINADTHPVMQRFHPADDEKRSVVLLEAHQVNDWLGATHEQARTLIAPFDPMRVRSVQAPRPARPSNRISSRASSPSSTGEPSPHTPSGDLFD